MAPQSIDKPLHFSELKDCGFDTFIVRGLCPTWQLFRGAQQQRKTRLEVAS